MDRIKSTLMSLTMPLLPKNHLSYAVGKLTRWQGPEKLTRWSVRRFAEFYGLNMNEAELPIDQYRTVGELFTRRLKAGARPIGEGLIHPVDAELTQAGRVQKDTLIQAKGKSYSLTRFLKNETLARKLDGGNYLTYYLCPTDYHRVHSPVDGELVAAYHIPGHLWPVNQWSVSRVDNLFSVNERVVMEIQTERGLVVQVMIGATNVGHITLSFDSELVTNQLRPDSQWRKRYQPPHRIHKGQELGLFSMGSSVVVLYDQNFGDVVSSAILPQKVRLGESVTS